MDPWNEPVLVVSQMTYAETYRVPFRIDGTLHHYAARHEEAIESGGPAVPVNYIISTDKQDSYLPSRASDNPVNQRIIRWTR